MAWTRRRTPDDETCMAVFRCGAQTFERVELIKKDDARLPARKRLQDTVPLAVGRYSCPATRSRQVGPRPLPTYS